MGKHGFTETKSTMSFWPFEIASGDAGTSLLDTKLTGGPFILGLRKDGLGYQVFNAGNDTNSVAVPNVELLKTYYEGVPVTRALGEHEALFSNRKIREVLGFKEEHDWRKYVTSA